MWGLKALMFKNRLLWLDYDGSLIGINYQSEAEKNKYAVANTQNKEHLHASLQDFEKAVLELETKYRKV